MSKMLGKIKNDSKALLMSLQLFIILILISTIASFTLFNIQKQKAIDNFQTDDKILDTLIENEDFHSFWIID